MHQDEHAAPPAEAIKEAIVSTAYLLRAEQPTVAQVCGADMPAIGALREDNFNKQHYNSGF